MARNRRSQSLESYAATAPITAIQKVAQPSNTAVLCVLAGIDFTIPIQRVGFASTADFIFDCSFVFVLYQMLKGRLKQVNKCFGSLMFL